MSNSKRECRVSRQQFSGNAKAVPVNFDGFGILNAEAREFSTGSFGWYANGKMQMRVDGEVVDVQIGVTMTVIGSKELPRTQEAGKEAA